MSNNQLHMDDYYSNLDMLSEKKSANAARTLHKYIAQYGMAALLFQLFEFVEDLHNEYGDDYLETLLADIKMTLTHYEERNSNE